MGWGRLDWAKVARAYRHIGWKVVDVHRRWPRSVCVVIAVRPVWGVPLLLGERCQGRLRGHAV